MIPITTFSGLDVAVFGLGSSGHATAAAMAAGGARVFAWDDNSASREAAARSGVPLADLSTADWSRFSALVLAPGVPLTHPEPHWTVKKAHAAGIEVIGDIELFCRERRKVCPAAIFIAITGTNGKSTTTALVAHMLREAGYNVQVGGNIGRPILTLEPLAAERIYVVECSSYQVDLAPTIDPTVGVLLNITPDHLDRHGTMENYAAVKERLVARSGTAIVGVDDPYCAAIADRIETPAKKQRWLTGNAPGVVRISVERELENGYFVRDGQVSKSEFGETTPLARLDHLSTLPGRHNWQNAAAALAVAAELNSFHREELWKAWAYAQGRTPSDGWQPGDPLPPSRHLKTFPGLAHRLERVAGYGPVDFFNDSKATNAESTEKALLSFDGPIYIILGGRAKEGGIEALRPHFSRITTAYLIGESSDTFAASLEGAVQYKHCGKMELAVENAATDALKANSAASVVLLSPACASFDQYRNFEERGDHFRVLVRKLIQRRGGT